jgi:hypothetical protein
LKRKRHFRQNGRLRIRRKRSERMAKLPESIPVSLEAVIHKSINDTFQDVADKHKINVNYISIEWTDVSAVGKPKFIISKIRIETETRPT